MWLQTVLANGKPVLVMSVEAMDELMAQIEVDKALDSWLGDDLSVFGIWNGPDDGTLEGLEFRNATTDEAAQWHASLQQAIKAGEQDAGETDWLVYLMPVTSKQRGQQRTKRRGS